MKRYPVNHEEFLPLERYRNNRGRDDARWGAFVSAYQYTNECVKLDTTSTGQECSERVWETCKL